MKEDMNRNHEYPFIVVMDEDGYHIIWPDLPGCNTHGDTLEEAIGNIDDALGSYLGALEKLGKELPKPTVLSPEYSGKLVLRMPTWLHRDCAYLAELQEVSLNQLLVSLISYALGHIKGTNSDTRQPKKKKTKKTSKKPEKIKA